MPNYTNVSKLTFEAQFYSQEAKENFLIVEKNHIEHGMEVNVKDLTTNIEGDDFGPMGCCEISIACENGSSRCKLEQIKTNLIFVIDVLNQIEMG